ncbi:hypothetical protein G9A89_019023 [Geosiphon pyriformis]|nr:hypothetical protein G9A89_019023 [Geosiphon pyriformis]
MAWMKIIDPLSPFLKISLEKKCVDLKIVKIQVEVSVKKSFVLDINLSAMEGKSAMAKTQFIRKIFSLVNSFGRATTPSKFERIIRSMFTSEESMINATSLAREKRIDVNSDLKKQEIHSDQAVVIKKIPINTPKDMIVAALAEFAVVEFADVDQAKQLAAKWFFLIGKDLVHVAMAVSDCKTWVLRDRFRALLFTLPIETTVHDLDTLLDKTGEKTCVINHSMDSGNQICCAVVGFNSEKNLESAYHTELIFGVKLSWARLDLVHCEKYGHLGHSALECNVPTPPIFKLLRPVKRVPSEDHHLWLAKFGPHFDSDFGSGLPLSGSLSIKKSALVVQNDSLINNCLASLECLLELLANQVSDIVHRLNGVELVSLVPTTQVVLLAASVSMLAPDTDMVLDVPQLSFSPLSPVLEDKVVDLGLSSSKVLTSKVGGLESKMMAFKVSISSILGKLDLLCLNLGFLVHLLHQ